LSHEDRFASAILEIHDGWITDEMHVLKRDYLPADLEPELDACGVHVSVAVQADQSESETHFLLQLAEQPSFIAGVERREVFSARRTSRTKTAGCASRTRT
jgi:predicted TIM-barrel fold metal-dependent hydrolase